MNTWWIWNSTFRHQVENLKKFKQSDEKDTKYKLPKSRGSKMPFISPPPSLHHCVIKSGHRHKYENRWAINTTNKLFGQHGDNVEFTN